MDHDFLVESYKDVIKGDPFIGQLIEMMKVVQKEGIHQKIQLTLIRADYLSHYDEKTKKIELNQVEVNAGQIGGPGYASNTTQLHSRVLSKLEALHGPEGMVPLLKHAVQPENRPRQRLGQALYEGWKLFGDPHAVVLFCTQPDLFPVCYFEQVQFIILELEDLAKADGKRINIMKMDFQECSKRVHLDEKDFTLYADGKKKIALVHQAYGYLPEHYPTEKEWKARLDMERSTAILSPSVRLQLVSTKKIQQVISKPGTLERFFPGEHARIAQLRQTFTDLWSLESNDAKTVAIIQEAIKTPKNFVLKSQMESGHGNFFDDEMVEKLKTMPLDERGAYILMKKIEPVVVKNYLFRPFKAPYVEDIVSEMGIYGAIIADGETGKVHWNSVDGHLCRSKPADVNQGGVCGGGGVIDSLLLYPSADFQ